MSGVFYSRGIVISAILAEGIRVAQAEYGVAEIDGPNSCAGVSRTST